MRSRLKVQFACRTFDSGQVCSIAASGDRIRTGARVHQLAIATWDGSGMGAFDRPGARTPMQNVLELVSLAQTSAYSVYLFLTDRDATRFEGENWGLCKFENSHDIFLPQDLDSYSRDFVIMIAKEPPPLYAALASMPLEERQELARKALQSVSRNFERDWELYQPGTLLTITPFGEHAMRGIQFLGEPHVLAPVLQALRGGELPYPVREQGWGEFAADMQN